MNDILCSIVLTNSNKDKVNSSIADLTTFGISIINNIRELNKFNYDLSRRVVILGDVTADEISDYTLFKKVLNLDLYYINTSDVQLELMRDISKVFNMSFNNINTNFLVSIFYNDKQLMKTFNYEFNDEELLEEKLTAMNSSNVDLLLNRYKSLKYKMNTIIDSKKLLEEQTEKIGSNLLSTYKNNESLTRELSRLISQYSDHYNSLKDYKILFTEDVYDTVNLTEFKKTPKIIYIKEYTELVHLNSFLTVLMNIIKLQKRSSVKLLRLYDSSDINRIKLLEESHLVVNGYFNDSKVINSDLILSYGGYRRLIETIIQTPLDYLIILDCKKFDNVVVLGDVLRLNTCRNPKDLDTFKLSNYNTITNNSNRTLSWNTYENYNKFKQDIDRFNYLSGRPIFKKIFELIDDMI